MEIRLATPEDGAACARIYAPVVRDTAISFEVEPPSGVIMTRRIVELRDRYPWLICQEGREALGYAYASPHRQRDAYRWSVEVSAYVDASARRRGIARRLYTALLDLLALQGYHNAFAGVTLPNPASVAFHEALGFTPVGIYQSTGFKLGHWHDVQWCQRLLPPPGDRSPPPDRVPPQPGFSASPPEPRRLSGLDRAEVDAVLGPG